MTALPQILVNVKDVNLSALATDKPIAELVARLEAELGETGRILLRPSGTEPLVRVMVEAASQERAEDVAHQVAALVTERLGL